MDQTLDIRDFVDLDTDSLTADPTLLRPRQQTHYPQPHHHRYRHHHHQHRHQDVNQQPAQKQILHLQTGQQPFVAPSQACHHPGIISDEQAAFLDGLDQYFSLSPPVSLSPEPAALTVKPADIWTGTGASAAAAAASAAAAAAVEDSLQSSSSALPLSSASTSSASSPSAYPTGLQYHQHYGQITPLLHHSPAADLAGRPLDSFAWPGSLSSPPGQLCQALAPSHPHLQIPMGKQMSGPFGAGEGALTLLDQAGNSYHYTPDSPESISLAQHGFPSFPPAAASSRTSTSTTNTATPTSVAECAASATAAACNTASLNSPISPATTDVPTFLCGGHGTGAVDDVGAGSGEDGASEKAKRERFLERNRVAASKCRQKKKEFIGDLEDRVRELGSTRNQLRAYVAGLRDEVLSLKGELLRHADCDCVAIRQYVQKEAALLSSTGPVSATAAAIASGRGVPATN